MILPDLNLLIYAYNVSAPKHAAARAWWEELMSSGEPVGLPWAVSLGFVRLMTSRSIFARPLEPATATACVKEWLSRPHVEVLDPGPRHLDILEALFGDLGVAGKLTTDAHLAALAIEYQSELHSHDTDFGRFSGLRWRDPLRAG